MQMNHRVLRRSFLAGSAALAGSLLCRSARAAEETFKISLAEWSLHRTLRAGTLDNLDFPAVAKHEFGIEAVEFVNQFFMDKAGDAKYLTELRRRADDLGVRCLIIMVDREGNLGDPALARRAKAVENHYKWVEAAKTLGCHAIRVNAGSGGTYQEQLFRAADGLRSLAEFAGGHGLDVIVENHGGLSSNGAWLAAVMKAVDLPNCGTLPDFGNFRIRDGEIYDRYRGVEELMPFAKAVSAKSHDFDDAGNETNTDFTRMMKIVLAAGYSGYVGIEYEGRHLDEYAGIHATKKLLERVRNQLG